MYIMENNVQLQLYNYDNAMRRRRRVIYHLTAQTTQTTQATQTTQTTQTTQAAQITQTTQTTQPTVKQSGDRSAHLRKFYLPNSAVPASKQALPSGTLPQRETPQQHGVPPLEDLWISDSSICHVCMYGGATVPCRPSASSTCNRYRYCQSIFNYVNT